MVMNFADDGSYIPTDADGERVDVPSYWVTGPLDDGADYGSEFDFGFTDPSRDAYTRYDDGYSYFEETKYDDPYGYDEGLEYRDEYFYEDEYYLEDGYYGEAYDRERPREGERGPATARDRERGPGRDRYDDEFGAWEDDYYEEFKEYIPAEEQLKNSAATKGGDEFLQKFGAKDNERGEET